MTDGTPSRREILRGTGAIAVAGVVAGCSASRCPRQDRVAFTADTDVFRVDRNDNAVEAQRFSLINDGECPVRVDPRSWRIDRRVDGEWKTVATGDGGDAIAVPGGRTHSWSLSLSTHPTPGGDRTTYVYPDGEFPAGTYRFGIHTTPSEGGEETVRRARFDLRYSASDS